MQLRTRFAAVIMCFLFSVISCVAQDGEGFIDDWQRRASRTQAEQPHWVTPLATVTPRLEQEIRYDLSWRRQPDGTTLANYGGGKGLELIPSARTELIIGIPPYIVHGNSVKDGFGDQSFLLKFRVLSQNEEPF